ncbi:MAG TPA: alpha/beta hydrolase-fold protein [Terriglobia bacterium]|nr:alpha/beta hydrolase-fold protein [Terriglobia bacterium]
MRFERTTVEKTGLLLTFCLLSGLSLAQNLPGPSGPSATGDAAAQHLAPGVSRVTSPPVGKTAGQSRRTGGDPVDDRVELREYGFKDTDENLPYAVFVSSKVTRDKKAPLVLALHGYSGNHGTFMRTGVVDEAEAGGYILVGVMGYSPSGPFGNSNMFGARGARGGTGAPGGRGDGPAAGPAAARGGQPGVRGGRGPAIGGTKETDAARVSELSEKDTMTVLAMVRKEFNIDDNRIYLMGHSMGGAGALYLGEKYAPLWTAVAALAGFGSPDPKGKLKDTPLYLTAGSLDTASNTGRVLAEQLKAAGMNCEFKEMPGLDHGGIIAGAMPDVFRFFNEHTKPQ